METSSDHEPDCTTARSMMPSYIPSFMTREDHEQVLAFLGRMLQSLSFVELISQYDYEGMALRMALARVVADIEEGHYSPRGFGTEFDSLLQWINPFQKVLDRSKRSVLFSATVLLALVYQYLIGYAHRGGSKLYSSGSLDFRDTYISIVLFQGSYVWIKFREVAGFKGVYRKQIPDKHGRITKVVYEPRFKPPRENGRILQWMYVGQYATPLEASILYQIAAFYYNEDGGELDLGDGRCFAIPPMRAEERRLTGKEKRAWVKVQTKKVYEDFKKEREKAEAEVLQELLAASEDQETQGHGEVNMVINDPSEASLPNTLNQQVIPVIQTHNLEMGIAMADDRFDTDLFDGMCAMDAPTLPAEGFDTVGVSTHDAQGFALGFHATGIQEGCSVPVAQLTPNTHSGLNFNTSNQLDLLQTLVSTQQQLISLQQQQLQEFRAQNSELQHRQQQQLQEAWIEISQLQNQQYLLEQQLQESRIQISQLQNQQYLQ